MKNEYIEVEKSIEEILLIFNAVENASKINIIESDLNFKIAKNLAELKPIFDKYIKRNNLRIKEFAKKNPETNKPISENGSFVWNDYDLAVEEHNNIVSEKVSIKIYCIKRSRHSDKLPAWIIASLIIADMIIE